ncbi:MAG: hypothetical protein HKN49_04485 [Gammaproteobacteria bacterium]|nr:hypothetical protein [Gammaproteobacteria bacterium]
MTIAARIAPVLLWIFAPGEVTAANGDLLVDAQIADGRNLCIVSDQVLELDRVECGARQKAERDKQSRVSNVLDRRKLDVRRAIDLSMLEGLQVGAQYRYSVEPSYRDNFYTRVDRYQVAAGAKPGDLLGALPVRIAIDRGTEIVFAQQFASGVEARSPLNTYLPDRLPINAGKALELKPGDYVRFDARLTLLTSVAQAWPLAGPVLTTGIDVSTLASGQYQVHVFRLGDERVRVKLVGQRSGNLSVGASFGQSGSIDIAFLDRRVAALVPIPEVNRSVRLAIEKGNDDLFLVDYTMNLADPQVRQAYDDIFHSARKLKTVTVANPVRDSFGLRDRLVGNLLLLEDLVATSDQQLVVRNFSGSSLLSSRSARFDFSLRTYNVSRERVYAENYLSRVSRKADGEVTERFLLPSWSRSRNRELFGKLREDMLRTADALFIVDERGRPKRFLNIGFEFDYRDSLLREVEYRYMRDKIALLLPPDGEAEMLSLLEDTRWLDEEDKHDARMQLSYYFREAAFDGLVEAGFGEPVRLREATYDFIIDALERDDFPYYSGDLDSLVARYAPKMRAARALAGDPQAQGRVIARALWKRKVNRAAANLALALDRDVPTSRRLDAFTALRNSGFFQSIGTALMAHLVQAAELDLRSVLYLELQLQADGHHGIHYTFGDPGERHLYDAVRFIRAVLNNRDIDMREPGQVESVVSRISVVED